MAEVVVAFMVLTIVMSLFAQGMKFSNNAERYAVDRTKDCDSAMKDLLDTVTSNGGGAHAGSPQNDELDGQPDLLKYRIYSAQTNGGGDNCIYCVYDADLS
jgi:hypothetical protein